MKLYPYVRSRLINRPRSCTLAEIAKSTGLSESWLSKVCSPSNYPPDPRVSNVEMLYEYLEQKPLVNGSTKTDGITDTTEMGFNTDQSTAVESVGVVETSAEIE